MKAADLFKEIVRQGQLQNPTNSARDHTEAQETICPALTCPHECHDYKSLDVSRPWS